MRPATFPPWRVSKVNPQMVTAKGDPIIDCRHVGDAAFVAHACNYYPHMAAMLRELILHPDREGYGATMARAYTLLESAGELTTEGG